MFHLLLLEKFLILEWICKIKGEENYSPTLSFKMRTPVVAAEELRDGFKRIFYIVLKMMSLKGKRILIDEIEIGIHYSKMKDFWINILKVGKELDVQLFATTH